MQLSDRKKPSDEELIDYIREHLIENEEPYAIGAWENFNRGDRSQRPLVLYFKRISIAAAVLLLAGSFIYLSGQLADNKPVSRIVQRHNDKLPAEKADEDANAANAVPVKYVERPVERITIEPAVESSEKSLVSALLYDPSAKDPISEVVDSVKSSTFTAGVNTKSSPLVKEGSTDLAFESGEDKFLQYLESEKKHKGLQSTVVKATKESDRWDLGIVVIPAYSTGDKVSMGYGLTMQYALSNRISLRSGLSYNILGGRQDYEQPESAVLLNARVLESSETNYQGIDIPLDISYNLTNSIYASTGLSAYAVFAHSQENRYSASKLVERVVRTAAGTEERMTFVENEKTVEKIQDAKAGRSEYLALYNFSVGYKQPIFKNQSISVEPFLKLPVGRTRGEGMQLLSTGLRIKIGI